MATKPMTLARTCAHGHGMAPSRASQQDISIRKKFQIRPLIGGRDVDG